MLINNVKLNCQHFEFSAIYIQPNEELTEENQLPIEFKETAAFSEHVVFVTELFRRLKNKILPLLPRISNVVLKKKFRVISINSSFRCRSVLECSIQNQNRFPRLYLAD